MKKLIVMFAMFFSLFTFNIFANDLKVAFVYVGPVGDGGWTFAHDLGRKELENLGTETTFVESVPESDAKRVLRRLARSGNKIIFTTSFGFMDDTLSIAKEFPDVIFMHCSGFKTHDNMGNYFARMYQARYLVGMVAGLTTKTDKIGIIGSHPIPEIIRHINAFTLGARSVNPKATVQVLWVNSWFDPAKEGSAANTLMDNGADVITITTDSAAATQAAEKRGKFAIGNDSDMTSYGPKAHLTANVFNWGVIYKDIYQKVQSGTWTPTSDWWGIETGAVGLAPFGDMVPEETRSLVGTIKRAIEHGELIVFEGPIKDQTGNIVIPEKTVPSDGDLLSMNFFVEGVIGELPKQ